MSRANALSVSGWRPLFEQAASRADEVQHGLRELHRAPNSIIWKAVSGRRICRKASSTPICFPTTCSFSASELSGMIDFYFACNDMLAYDVAICLNAWCFESDNSFNVTKARALSQRL